MWLIKFYIFLSLSPNPWSLAVRQISSYSCSWPNVFCNEATISCEVICSILLPSFCIKTSLFASNMSPTKCDFDTKSVLRPIGLYFAAWGNATDVLRHWVIWQSCEFYLFMVKSGFNSILSSYYCFINFWKLSTTSLTISKFLTFFNYFSSITLVYRSSRQSRRFWN